MTLLALVLILVSALLHASWNLLAKRAAGGAAFVWLFAALSALLYAPLAVAYLLLERPVLGPLELGFIAGSGVIHLGYFLSLQRGYRTGDLSLVYPLARGSGPLLATVVAVLLLGERPTALAGAGTALIVVSVFLLTGGSRMLAQKQRQAVLYGLLTGVLIATYTVWDGYAVRSLAIHPLLFTWLSECLRTLFLLPFVLTRRAELAGVWRRHRGAAFGVAVLSPLAYLLVLTALSFTPISYVAPAREISILVGAVMGARLLAEGDAGRRLTAAAGMVVGVALLALG